MKTLYEVNPADKLYHAKYVEYNGKKFRFICETRNGDPIGFKSNKCIQVMTGDGTFSSIADCCMLGFRYQNSYHQSKKEEEKYCTELFKTFEDFLTKVY